MWKVVEVLVAMSWRSASPSGPIFLYQDRSIRWEASFCPLFRRFVELRRWDRGLKYPSVREKFVRVFCFGWVKVCVMFESSRARIIPRIVTIMAAVFVIIGIVIGGVFVGIISDVMSRPAMMLPRARRVIGLVIAGSFSFIGVIGGIRVNPVWTSRVMRMV